MPAPAAPAPAPTEKRLPRVRLRAATRRVPRARPAGSEPDGREEEPPEPNMKLSRALVVMLLLHLVAVGGVLAFGFIKERPAAGRAVASTHPGAVTPSSTRATSAATAPPSEFSPPRPAPASVGIVSRPVPAPSSRAETDALRLIEGGAGLAERTYTVGRGETLSSIALKFRLNPDSLLRLNDIDDPRKIRVGQKLRLPPAAKPKS